MSSERRGLERTSSTSALLRALGWAQSNANNSFSPSLRFSALLCVAIIVANQTRLLKQCWEEFIEILRKSLRAFSVEVTWRFLSWIKQTFLVPRSSVGLVKRAALTLWGESIKKIYRRGLCAEQTKRKAGITHTCHKADWSCEFSCYFEGKKLEPDSVYFFCVCVLRAAQAQPSSAGQQRLFSMYHLKELWAFQRFSSL